MGKLYKKIILFSFLFSLIIGSAMSAETKAKRIRVIDSGGYYTGTDAETVLQEVGASLVITGTDTHVMFFDGDNNPAGDAGMTYNKTTDTITVVNVSLTDLYLSTVQGNIILNDDAWIGNASDGGRFIFDSTPTPDLVTLDDADLTIATGFKLKTGTVQWTKAASDYIDADAIQDGSTNAIPTLTQETAWDALTTESTTVTSPLVLTTYDISIPAATNSAAGHASAAHITAIEANTLKETNTDDQTLAEVLAEGAIADVDIQLGEVDIKLDAVLSGDATWSGITIAGTSGVTTLAVGDLCYLNNDDSEWYLVDANLSDGYDKQLGICVLIGANAAATEMLIYGKVRAATFPATFTVGSPLYISETAGDMTHTAPTTTDAATRVIGIAITAEDLLFNPSNDYYTHT